MTKMLRRVMAAVLVLMLTGCCALANEIPEEITAREGIHVPESFTGLAEALKAQEAVKGGLNMPVTSDVVSFFNDGSISVITDGVNITTLPPFGWYVLTQDLASQYDTFSMLYNSGVLTEPASAVSEMISNGFHFLMLDPYYGSTILVTVGTDGLSSFVTDSSALTPAEITMVEGIVADANYFPTSIISTGMENFVRYDMRDVDGTIIYSCYHNGLCIDFNVLPGSADIDAELANIEYMLYDVFVTPAY